MLNHMTTTRSFNIFSLIKLLLLLVIGVLLVMLMLLVFILQSQPTVPPSRTLDNVDMQTIEQLIVDNAPEKITSPGERILHLDRTELNLLTAFALQTVPALGEMAADVTLSNGSATVDIAAPWHIPRKTVYLNLQAQVRQRSTGLELFSVRAGDLPIPMTLVRYAIRTTQDRLASAYVNYQEFVDLQQSIRQISIEEAAVIITLDWEPQLITRVQAQAEQLFLSADDKDRIVVYYQQIADIVNALPENTRSISLNDLMFPLFFTAAKHVHSGKDAVTENRSLLQALSLYVNETEPSALIGEDSLTNNARPRRVNVTIQRRTDLAQHFTTSAAITATAGAGVAGILYNSKEAHDARYRTGFSFSDLTANMAGAAFGDTSTGSIAAALQIQQRVTIATEETDYMPQVTRDNAGMTEQVFSEQYQDRTSEAYLDRVATIDLEIAALPVYSGAK